MFVCVCAGLWVSLSCGAGVGFLGLWSKGVRWDGVLSLCRCHRHPEHFAAAAGRRRPTTRLRDLQGRGLLLTHLAMSSKRGLVLLLLPARWGLTLQGLCLFVCAGELLSPLFSFVCVFVCRLRHVGVISSGG